MKEKSVKIWVYVVSICITCLLFFLICLTTVQLFKIKKLKKEQTSLKDKFNTLLQTEAYYTDANKYVQSDEFIEDYAREILGLGKDGEESYN